MSFTDHELFAISVTERACSAISLVGTTIIIGTFVWSKSFRKPINRLVFYASWGNIMTNIATLISRSGITHGTGGSLCQLQAFLIQWFMPADALWTFAMACNVYLTFFHKYNSEQLRRLEWKYLLFCYGLPLIPSFAYFFIETQDRGPVYGSAILWCWVSLSWDFLRIAIFYGPVWFVIFLTFSIYVRAGRMIYTKRRELHEIGTKSFDHESPFDLHCSKITEIHVTCETQICPQDGQTLHLQLCEKAHLDSNTATNASFTPYSVTIEGGGGGSASTATTEVPLSPMSDYPDTPISRRPVASESNTAAWVYTKYAMLFFIALLVTWVPSTINRVWALARPYDYNFALNYASSFVLPLQGFWNSIIYVSISWPAFKSLVRDIRRSPRARRHQTPMSFPTTTGFGGIKQRTRNISFGEESSREFVLPITLRDESAAV